MHPKTIDYNGKCYFQSFQQQHWQTLLLTQLERYPDPPLLLLCFNFNKKKKWDANERQALDRFVEKYKKFMNLFFISHSIANGMQILSWGVLTWFGCLWFFYRILFNYAQLNEIMSRVFANLLFDVIHLKLFLCNCLLTN